MKSCIVRNCPNTTDTAEFVGDFCGSCYEFVRTGHGADSQVFKNADSLLKRRLKEASNSAQIALSQAREALRGLDKYVESSDTDAEIKVHSQDVGLLNTVLVTFDSISQPFVALLDSIELHSVQLRDEATLYKFNGGSITVGTLRRLRDMRRTLGLEIELAKKSVKI